MFIVGLIAIVIVGWLGWTLWLAIPFGLFLFWGSLRALPGQAGRVGAAGIIGYCFVALILLALTRWVHGLISN